MNIFLCNNVLKGCVIMPDYEKLYHKTYNAITDAERLIETAANMLRIVQQQCEKIYIEADLASTEEDRE